MIQLDLWEKTMVSHDSKQTQCYKYVHSQSLLTLSVLPKSLTTIDVSRYKTLLLMLSIFYPAVNVILILCSFLAPYWVLPAHVTWKKKLRLDLRYNKKSLTLTI